MNDMKRVKFELQQQREQQERQTEQMKAQHISEIARRMEQQQREMVQIREQQEFELAQKRERQERELAQISDLQERGRSFCLRPGRAASRPGRVLGPAISPNPTNHGE